MLIGQIAAVDDFFAQLPRKADLFVINQDGTNGVVYFVLNDIAVQCAAEIPLNDARLAGAVVVNRLLESS